MLVIRGSSIVRFTSLDITFKKKSPILIDDIKNVISSDVNGTMDDPLLTNINSKPKSDSNLENYKILFDPTYKINSENDKDFVKLFDSRYRKTLKILSIRSESRQIRKIKQIRDLRNKSRSSSLDNDNERGKFVDSVF